MTLQQMNRLFFFFTEAAVGENVALGHLFFMISGSQAVGRRAITVGEGGGMFNRRG